MLKLTVRDPGAPEDMPAWCRMTERRLLRADHPTVLDRATPKSLNEGDTRSVPGKFCVNLTSSGNDPDKATVGFVVANAALGSEKETLVFLSTEGVRLAEKGYADRHPRGRLPPPHRAHGRLRRRGRASSTSAPPASRSAASTRTTSSMARRIVGGAMLVEFLSDGAPSVSY